MGVAGEIGDWRDAAVNHRYADIGTDITLLPHQRSVDGLNSVIGRRDFGLLLCSDRAIERYVLDVRVRGNGVQVLVGDGYRQCVDSAQHQVDDSTKQPKHERLKRRRRFVVLNHHRDICGRRFCCKVGRDLAA
jgi:hypothetical protein